MEITAVTDEDSAGSPRFQDVAELSGIRFVYRNGGEANQATILESLGGGVAMLDYDRDGYLDLCFTGGGTIDQDVSLTPRVTGFFRHRGEQTYQQVPEIAGIQAASQYSHGAHAADYDNDGFSDVLITGYGGLQLWRNQGDGTFTEVHRDAGLNDDSWSTSAAWVDTDRDGDLDLYVCHYVNWSADNHPFCPGLRPDQREICTPRTFQPLPDTFYLNNGDGSFRDAGQEMGVYDSAGQPLAGKGLGVLACDVDNDGDAEIYVTNDTVANYLFVNDGKGQLKELGQLAGVAFDDLGIPNGSMGVDAIDFNGDGRLDLWVANYERESFALYRNEGNAQFLHVSQSAGISALDGLFVGFGTACFDIDLDGDEDIVVVNGHVNKFPAAAPLRQLPLILINDNNRFRRVAYANGFFATAHESRGLACGDLDNDGDLDLAVSRQNEPAALLVNDTPSTGHWLGVRLVGVESNRDAIGARLTLQTSSGDQIRQVKGGGSYLSQNDLRVHWGIAEGVKVIGMTIAWPSGREQHVSDIDADKHHTIIEPTND